MSDKQFSWLTFRPTKHTVVAVVTGAVIVLLNALSQWISGTTLLERLGYLVVRDILMIAGVGVAFPLYYTLISRKGSLKDLLITTDRWVMSLTINFILAGVLLTALIQTSGKNALSDFLSLDAAGSIFYIMVTGIFECMLFYGFLRFLFEEAFGILPGILCAALFYGMYHAGFTPKFAEFFAAGIIYASVLRLTQSALAAYPFFWGVGACWYLLTDVDALQKIQATQPWLRGVGIILMIMAIARLFSQKMRKMNAGDSAPRSQKPLR